MSEVVDPSCMMYLYYDTPLSSLYLIIFQILITNYLGTIIILVQIIVNKNYQKNILLWNMKYVQHL